MMKRFHLLLPLLLLHLVLLSSKEPRLRGPLFSSFASFASSASPASFLLIPFLHLLYFKRFDLFLVRLPPRIDIFALFNTTDDILFIFFFKIEI